MHMPDLPACSARAGQDPAVNDNAAADAGSQRHHNEIPAALSAAHPHLTQSGHIGVISRHDGHVQQIFQRVLNAEGSPAKINRPVNHPFAVYRARGSDAHSHNGILVDPFHLFPDTVRNIGKNMGTFILGPRGNLPLVKYVSLCVKQSKLYGRSTHIHSKYVFLHHCSPCSIFISFFRKYSFFEKRNPSRPLPFFWQGIPALSGTAPAPHCSPSFSAGG